MAHIRATIRSQAVTALTSLTTTGANVFDSRAFPLQQSQLPCLLIYTDAESSSEGNLTSLERVTELTVKGIARATSDVDSTLDTIAVEVEGALSIAVAKDVLLVSTDVEFSGEGDNQFAAILLTFEVLTHTSRSDPETAI